MANFNFIPSFDGNVSPGQPLMVFSHIPKSAGTSFNSAIIAAYGQHGVANHLVGRIYTSNLLEIKEKVDRHKQLGHPITGFISTTIPVKTITTFNVPVRLVTIVREASSRVISHYCYQCMRAQSKPTLEKFIEFYRLAENQNVACRTVLGTESIGTGDGLQAYQMLEQYYYAYCTIKDINALTMSVLSTEGLPNVVMAKENYTLSEYKLTDIPTEVLAEIAQLNQEDSVLYENVLARPKIPNPINKSSINGNTIKITCDQNEERYKGIVESFLTTDLGNYAPDVKVTL